MLHNNKRILGWYWIRGNSASSKHVSSAVTIFFTVNIKEEIQTRENENTILARTEAVQTRRRQQKVADRYWPAQRWRLLYRSPPRQSLRSRSGSSWKGVLPVQSTRLALDLYLLPSTTWCFLTARYTPWMGGPLIFWILSPFSPVVHSFPFSVSLRSQFLCFSFFVGYEMGT